MPAQLGTDDQKKQENLEKQFECHRAHFEKTGMHRRSQSADRRVGVRVDNKQLVEGKKTSVGSWLWRRLPFASAEAYEGTGKHKTIMTE